MAQAKKKKKTQTYSNKDILPAWTVLRKKSVVTASSQPNRSGHKRHAKQGRQQRARFYHFCQRSIITVSNEQCQHKDHLPKQCAFHVLLWIKARPFQALELWGNRFTLLGKRKWTSFSYPIVSFFQCNSFQKFRSSSIQIFNKKKKKHVLDLYQTIKLLIHRLVGPHKQCVSGVSAQMGN